MLCSSSSTFCDIISNFPVDFKSSYTKVIETQNPYTRFPKIEIQISLQAGQYHTPHDISLLSHAKNRNIDYIMQ